MGRNGLKAMAYGLQPSPNQEEGYFQEALQYDRANDYIGLFRILDQVHDRLGRRRTNHLKATLAIRATIGPTREPP
jgi:hypothetical protein